MRGLPQFGFPAFDAARDRLAAQGHRVISPADMDRANRFDVTCPVGDEFIHQAMRRDMVALAGCDAIYLLRGWERSQGAQVELAAAQSMGLEVLTEDGAADPDAPESVLAEAERLVGGDRNDAYGHPADDMGRTGRMWGAILHLDRDVTAEEVAMCMVAVKLSRESNVSKRDNRVDIAGYALCLDRIAQRRFIRSQ